MSGSSASVRPQPGIGKLLVVALPAAFAVTLATAVAFGLWRATTQQEFTPAARELAGYHLIDAIAGQEAIAAIEDLHGEEIDIVDAWVAQYQGNATVWVARAIDERQAASLLEDMLEGIEEGDSPFWGLASRKIHGLPIFSLTDGRQMHFFYQRAEQVVWVATPRGDEEPFLTAVLEKVD